MKEQKEILVFPDHQDPRANLASGLLVSLALLQPYLGLKVAREIPDFQGKKEIVALGVLMDPQVSQ